MAGGIPFRSRHRLEWRLVLVDPVLVERVERLFRATGPSHAIEEALRRAAGGDDAPRVPKRMAPPIH